MQEQAGPDASEVMSLLAAESRRSLYLKRWLLAGGGVVSLLALGAGLNFLASVGKDAPEYFTEPVLRQSLTVQVTATGQLAPVNQVEVGSELSGRISRVLVDFNDHIEKGQTLARLDTSELDAAVVQAQAALALARARVQQALATRVEADLKLQRRQALVAQNLASREELDINQATLARADADLVAARAQVEQASAAVTAVQSKLEKSLIRAPISGMVLSRNVEPGQTVAATFNTPVLFDLAEDLTRMSLHVDVDEADVGHLAPGQVASFSVDAYPGQLFTAEVTEVRYAPRTIDGVVTYETLLAVSNQAMLLRPGMTATAEIQVAVIDDALQVANAALRFKPAETQEETRSGGSILSRLVPRHGQSRRLDSQSEQQASVWVLDGDVPREVRVQAGLTDGRYTVIQASELQAGMSVITGLRPAA